MEPRTRARLTAGSQVPTRPCKAQAAPLQLCLDRGVQRRACEGSLVDISSNARKAVTLQGLKATCHPSYLHCHTTMYVTAPRRIHIFALRPSPHPECARQT